LTRHPGWPTMMLSFDKRGNEFIALLATKTFQAQRNLQNSTTKKFQVPRIFAGNKVDKKGK
jgi:hypothetical protein